MKHETNLYPLPGFCERLKEAREKAGLSQNELGKRVDSTRDTVRSYERGYRIPTLTIIAKIAAVLNVSLDWLAFGKEKETNDS